MCRKLKIPAYFTSKGFAIVQCREFLKSHVTVVILCLKLVNQKLRCVMESLQQASKQATANKIQAKYLLKLSSVGQRQRMKQKESNQSAIVSANTIKTNQCSIDLAKYNKNKQNQLTNSAKYIRNK